jgi:hypothetical protein
MGSQIAYSHPRTGGATKAVGALVVMVRVEVAEPFAAGVAEAGFNEHAGARTGSGSTEQVNCTSLLKLFTELRVTVDVRVSRSDRCRRGCRADSEKSGAGTKVAVTLRSLLIVTLHASVPEQAPPQFVSVESPAAVAVRATIVPSLNRAEHAPGQLMRAGLLVTMPLPVPDVATVRVNCRTTVLSCVAELLAGARSFSVADTLIVLVIVPVAVGVTTMVHSVMSEIAMLVRRDKPA